MKLGSSCFDFKKKYHTQEEINQSIYFHKSLQFGTEIQRNSTWNSLDSNGEKNIHLEGTKTSRKTVTKHLLIKKWFSNHINHESESSTGQLELLRIKKCYILSHCNEQQYGLEITWDSGRQGWQIPISHSHCQNKERIRSNNQTLHSTKTHYSSKPS